MKVDEAHFIENVFQMQTETSAGKNESAWFCFLRHLKFLQSLIKMPKQMILSRGYRIRAITTAFQAVDAGSSPATRSMDAQRAAAGGERSVFF